MHTTTQINKHKIDALAFALCILLPCATEREANIPHSMPPPPRSPPRPTRDRLPHPRPEPESELGGGPALLVVVGAGASGLAGGELDEEVLPDDVRRGRRHHEHAAEVVEAEAAEELHKHGNALAISDGKGRPIPIKLFRGIGFYDLNSELFLVVPIVPMDLVTLQLAAEIASGDAGGPRVRVGSNGGHIAEYAVRFKPAMRKAAPSRKFRGARRGRPIHPPWHVVSAAVMRVARAAYTT